MPVFLNNAEEKLVEHIEMLHAERQQWRMVVFVSSKTNREFSGQLYSTNSSKLLMEAANEVDAIIFRCNDNEVAFLFKQRPTQILPRLKRLMLDIFTLISENDVDFSSAFHLYDLYTEFDQAISIAYEKLRLKKYRAQFRDGIPEPAIPTWDEELFQTALHIRSTRKQPLIALAEDEPTVRHMAGMILRSKYDTVITADNGGTALDLYNEHAPDLMFLDINMPVINGMDVLARILAVDKTASIIMFTVHNIREHIQSALQIGAKGYIVKPFNAGALLKQAERILGESKKQL